MQFKRISFSVDKDIDLPSLPIKEKSGHAKNENVILWCKLNIQV